MVIISGQPGSDQTVGVITHLLPRPDEAGLVAITVVRLQLGESVELHEHADVIPRTLQIVVVERGYHLRAQQGFQLHLQILQNAVSLVEIWYVLKIIREV